MTTSDATLAALVAEVKAALQRSIEGHWKLVKVPNAVLGALVQAVEDQQRVGLCPMCGKPSHSKCNHCGEEFYTYHESLASTNDRLAPVVRELKAEVAQLRADGQRLREKVSQWRALAADIHFDAGRTDFDERYRLETKARQLEACALELEVVIARVGDAP